MHDIEALLYDVVNISNQPSIKVHVNGSNILFVPEKISAIVFEDLRRMAEAYLNRTVQDAVVTVPSHFHEAQRLATKEAAAMAGLNVIRIVNASMAAGVAYGIDTLIDHQRPDRCKECYFVIYDIEATETDVVLESIDFDGVFKTCGVTTTKDFGGNDIENAVLNHALSEFHSKYNIDITKDLEGVKRLKPELERARKTLLSESSANIEFLADGSSIPISITITKSQIQELDRKLSNRVRTLLDRLLENAKKEKKDINGMLFTGNLEHVAKVQPIVEAYFDGKKAFLRHGIRPNTAIALGAAIQGRRLSSDDGCRGLTIDVTALGLGVETSGDVFTTLIPQGTVIPTLKRLVFSTATDNQDKITIKVLEGERAIASKNRVLGTLELIGLPIRPRHDLDVEILFEVDANSILTVVARVSEAGKEARLVFTDMGFGRYTEEEIDEIVMDGNSHYEEDSLLLRDPALRAQSRKDELWVRYYT